MPRVAKTDIHASLARAAELIRQSDRGGDGVISRADIKAKLATMEQGTERALVDMFYRFADHRDHKPNARITAKDLEKTLAYAYEKLVNQYDTNKNGLSKAEIAKMSTTAQLAVKLAQETKLAERTPSGPLKIDALPSTAGASEVVAWN